MDKLLKLLGQELFDQVKNKLGNNSIIVASNDEKYILDDGKSFIPKHRFDEVIAQKNSLADQINLYKKQLDELKVAAEGNSSLTKQIEDLQKKNKQVEDEFKTKELEIKKSFAIKEALLNEGVSDPDARDLLLSKFKLDAITLTEDGKINTKDFENLIKPIKDNKTLSALFGSTKIKGNNPSDKKQFNGNDLLTFEQIQAMNQEEVNANLELVNKSLAAINKQ